MHILGHVCELVRYSVKSMAGIVTQSAFLGWHGLAGDRRFAFRRLGDDTGFPWLSASRLPELLLYHPFGLDESTGEPLPTHIRTPAGDHLELRSTELQRDVAERLGSGVELPITRVIVGPGPHPDQAKDSIERFLQSKGLSHIAVEASPIPLRP